MKRCPDQKKQQFDISRCVDIPRGGYQQWYQCEGDDLSFLAVLVLPTTKKRSSQGKRLKMSTLKPFVQQVLFFSSVFQNRHAQPIFFETLENGFFFVKL